MSRKSLQPALYEKMRLRSGLLPPRGEPVVVEPPEPVIDQPRASRWLTPGHSLRLPVGYVLLAIGMAIIIVTLAYVAGHKRGGTLAKANAEEGFLRNLPADLNDPLQASPPLVDVPAANRRGAAGAAAGNGSRIGSAGPQNGWWGPLAPAVDPRRKGFSYLVLVETSPQGAMKLAEFCRTHGLESYVVPGKNGTRKVIAFPGFDLGVVSRTGPEASALKQKVFQIGAQWAQQARGNSNLGDSYFDRHGG